MKRQQEDPEQLPLNCGAASMMFAGITRGRLLYGEFEAAWISAVLAVLVLALTCFYYVDWSVVNA